jgi:hypothetical protein
MADPPAVHPKTGEELVIECFRGTPGAIDGNLNDWDLGTLTPIILNTEEQLHSGQGTWDNPEDSSGEFYLQWDDENIYIAVVMKDDTLSMNKTGGDIWNADCIEVFFSTLSAVGGHDEHYQYGFNANEQTWNWCNMDSGGQSAITYLQVASTETTDGYICEAAIEYGQMLSLDFSAGNTIGFHAVFDDTDNGDRELQMTWSGFEAHDQSQGFGHLLLSDAAVKPGFSSGPSPANGALVEETWVTMSWRPGEFAVSHDVYMGDNFDDVNEATRDSELFRINQDLIFYVAGFAGYAYPDGLIPGTTYYWRIDEVNDNEPNSPWKGDVWSFSVPPKTAYLPNPVEGAESVDLNVVLTWTAGYSAKMHYIVFGKDFDEVNNAETGIESGPANYSPGPLELAKTYYWRIDEYDGDVTHKGEVWSFTTLGAVTGPNPDDGAADVKPSVVLKWEAGAVAASHEVYFGADADAVKNATKSSPEYKGPKDLGEESYDPGLLSLNTAYFWRIDEVNSASPDSPWAGGVWSFTTGDYFVIDDFEDYDIGNNEIWFAWNDGLGAGTPGIDPYVPSNGTGSMIGDDTTDSYTEETIVHGGGQSMPYWYDNNKVLNKYSEAVLTLSDVRDWTAEGVAELSLWFRGYPASTGSFVESPAGTFTMNGSGSDIWDSADEFHYAYRTLTGVGSIQARVLSMDHSHNWSKAGVMIRETLDAGSVHATMVVTPEQGASFQRRPVADDVSSNTDSAGIAAPYWVKVERDIAGNFKGYISANGSTWDLVGTESIPMGSSVYIGLAVTSHDAALTCEAVFTNVTTSGNAGTMWANQDIGIASNDPEPLYVAVSNSAGTPAVVVHDDVNAATIDAWTEWVIPLSAFSDQGINLTNVDKIAIGLGTKGNTTAPGGSGKIFIDDIRLNQPKEAAAE